jgi:hypothetical protein
MEVQSDYVLSALGCIEEGLLHYELRHIMVRRGRAAVQLSTATEHLIREKLRLLNHPDPDVRIPYAELAQLLVPSHLRQEEAKSLTRYRRKRNEAVHSATQIEENELSEFEGSTRKILRLLQRFLTQELLIDPLYELDSCFVQLLRGEKLDFHDKADLRSRAALDSVLVDRDADEGVELANDGFDFAVRAVASGVGLPADCGTTDEVLRVMKEQGRDNEAWCSIHDEYMNLEPGDFQKDRASFSDIIEVEEYVRLLREVVVDLLSRAHRLDWEERIRRNWPDIVALVNDRSPSSVVILPRSALDVTVMGSCVGWVKVVDRPPGLRFMLQAVEAAIRSEVPRLPREFSLVVGPIISRRTVRTI